MRNSVFFVGALLIQIASIAHADVLYSESSKEIWIGINGEIQRDDDQTLARLIQNARNSFDKSPRRFSYSLNSTGGDLATAMKMGRLMRNAPLRPIVIIESKSSCLSSCIFLLVAGSDRYVDGKVGIHRPYLVNDSAQSEDAQKQQFQNIEFGVKSYLSEMNVPASLYDDMIRVSPTKIKILTKADLESYGLDQADPFAESALNARIAASLKITTGEYIKRVQRADQECGVMATQQRRNCRSSIIAGKR